MEKVNFGGTIVLRSLQLVWLVVILAVARGFRQIYSCPLTPFPVLPHKYRMKVMSISSFLSISWLVTMPDFPTNVFCHLSQRQLPHLVAMSSIRQLQYVVQELLPFVNPELTPYQFQCVAFSLVLPFWNGCPQDVLDYNTHQPRRHSRLLYLLCWEF